jgi:hypothetical protein
MTTITATANYPSSTHSIPSSAITSRASAETNIQHISQDNEVKCVQTFSNGVKEISELEGNMWMSADAALHITATASIGYLTFRYIKYLFSKAKTQEGLENKIGAYLLVVVVLYIAIFMIIYMGTLSRNSIISGFMASIGGVLLTRL